MRARGGGVGGGAARDSARRSPGGSSTKLAGPISTGFGDAGGNSSVLSHGADSFFFSDFFPAAMALQRGQG